MMVFLKEAKHAALQPACVMSQHRVTCDDLILSLVERGGRPTVTASAGSAATGRSCGPNSHRSVCGSVGSRRRSKKVSEKNEL